MVSPALVRRQDHEDRHFERAVRKVAKKFSATREGPVYWAVVLRRAALELDVRRAPEGSGGHSATVEHRVIGLAGEETHAR